ncbi:phosphonate transport system ATP-binding protein [Lacicoccus qingdaonensis]|uniref:Phosphonate transport system ATP-binding protein n=1 Tax=Lacicoccus qingdaonensis TaxID=576118 RepID=A0A1G9J0X6_9BACL|nr:phosphonate transport system ATP-binding protein [Salinicoccus qingdaonensis]
MVNALIEFNDVSLVYPNGHKGLKNINLKINEGEFVVIVGMSGAGKSTLIRSINRMVTPTSGELIVDGEDILQLKDSQLRKVRTNIGMIFQSYNIVKRMSVLRNVLAGRLGHTGTLRSLVGWFPQNDLQIAMNNLERVGIDEKAYVRASNLSGGQQQRVSIARALTQQPKVILADEPVASLDPPTSHKVMKDLKRVSREDGLTTIVNLHFIDMAMEYADRIIGLRDGNLVFDGPIEEVTDQTFEEIYDRPIKDDDFLGSEEETDEKNESEQV